MSQFRNQSFASRFSAMGDEAEGKYEELCGVAHVRFGLNRPPVSMKKLPPFIRYQPDYLTSNGLVECQGVGKDRILKVKIEKALALQQWHSMFDLTMWVWDSTNERCADWPWAELWKLLPTMPVEHFPEGKAYWAINVDDHLFVSGDD